MHKFILATENKNKVEEFKQIIQDSNIELVCLSDIGLSLDVEETGTTFQENALIKARYVYELTKMPTIADDSGLEIEALGNFPGIKSARFEKGKPYSVKNKTILEMMKDKKNRNASFKCAICVYGLNKEPLFFIGEFKGQISYKAMGENGFGYDPIFYFPLLNKTAAMMSDEEKNAHSHRGIALSKLKEYLYKKGNENNYD